MNEEFEKGRERLRKRIMSGEVDINNIKEEAIKLMEIDPISYIKEDIKSEMATKEIREIFLEVSSKWGMNNSITGIMVMINDLLEFTGEIIKKGRIEEGEEMRNVIINILKILVEKYDK